MEPFLTTCGIVLPTFLLIAVGYLLQLTGVIDEVGSDKMNILSFRVLIPTMVFYNIYSSPLDTVTNWKLMGFSAAAITGIFLVLMVVMPRLEKDNGRRGVMVQGMFRSSFVVLGLGLVSSMYPGVGGGPAALLSAVIAPLFNGYAVVALETFGAEKSSLKRIVRGIVTNPLIVASVLAILLLLLGWRLPPMGEQLASTLSSLATPLALLVCGSAFRFGKVSGHLRQLVITCAGKLLIIPLILVPLSVAAGFRDIELLTLLVLFASPTTVSSHIMAYNAGGDGQLAGDIVVFSTCFSVVTLFGFIYLLLSMGYF